LIVIVAAGRVTRTLNACYIPVWYNTRGCGYRP
jgi:hypothetical protein